VGSYAGVVPERPERSPAAAAVAVNDYNSSVRKEETTRAQSSGGARARLLDRLSAENNLATEARLRSQARLRARLAAERRLAKQDGDDGTAQGASGDSAPGTHVS